LFPEHNICYYFSLGIK